MKENIHLGGWEVNFNDNEELEHFILQHRLSKKDFDVFTKIQSGLEMITENGRIIEVLNQPGNERVSGPLEFKIPKSEANKLFWLKHSTDGNHLLGGFPPKNLKILCDATFKPFFIGSIDCTDDEFNWLGMNRFPIFYPLDFYSESVYIDYALEDRPEIVKEGIKVEFEPKIFLSQLKYEVSENVKIEELENELNPIHQCGVPLWYQYPELPRCPKTGDLMKFVCSISSDRNIQILKKGIWGLKKTDEFLKFGDMGTLYVFFNPKSRIAFKTIQF
ncbi:hypothetical protein P872_11665 [Rhodonellum psychrophilum GCM71 = DSM 17998]|uniref:DUF1963 domain-containing protein n=2 Tax=Rhodonellum TaxID=336827 RepID=U5BKP4_9BACT|nr:MULTISPECIES: hypothetical protein [Rhodonellum]ERM81035.1 hypothetical protein P872_11665 [Rhodonellum psychrophilum GCM71 = DSM 17998]SDZ38997.1 hypothetical protein SAMN05444412_11283 [Rhodonellum ikkaensis]